MGRETQMDGLRTMGNYCLVSFPADFDSYPVSELETRGGGMGLRFAYGLANAVSTANISRMDEGDEFHNGGKFQEWFGIKHLHRFALQKPYRGAKGRITGGDGAATGARHW